MSEKAEADKADKQGGLWETIKVILQALALALVIRTLLFQPFSIPSGSMMPTLLAGDYLFVNKFTYGYSRYSLPFGPDLFDGRVWSGDPERGDVVVFKLPHDPSVDYVKRVIGLPGDRVQVIDGLLHINGDAVKRERKGEFLDDQYGVRVPVFVETLPNGVSYETLDLNPNGVGDNTRIFEVPAGHYFMMGDNRDNSIDSRFDVRYVPVENLVGPARIVFFSVGEGAHPLAFWRWPSAMRIGRLFKGL